MTIAVNPDLNDRAPSLASAFQEAQPFRHVVIDDFFTGATCQQLLDEFPTFDQSKAINEAGDVGGKSVHEDIASISAGYAALDELVKSQPFLALVESITGIPDLIHDPYYFGGGTHENCHGQDLDPHIDFNHHPITDDHRRLNLIVFLNADWHPDWGGMLELHKDPWQREEDYVSTVPPAFNRAVIFETTERSWHGFRRINLPESERNNSRKSFALYYYTRTRPEAETGNHHSTVYVDRQLPEEVESRLSAEDLETVRVLLKRRDDHIRRLYGDIEDLSGQLHVARNYLNHPRIVRWGLNLMLSLWRLLFGRRPHRGEE